MKIFVQFLVIAAIAAVLSGCCCAGQCALAVPAAEKAANMQKTCAFLKAAKVYYIATVEDGQPRVRPFGTVNIFEGKLYIQTGAKKKVARQIMANPKVELCAKKGGEWLRLSGTLVNDPRKAAKESMLNAYPGLKKMYSADDPNTLVLYFQNATAEICSFTHPTVVMKF